MTGQLVLRKALEVIASWRCENYTPHAGKVGAECFSNGRTEEAEYTANRACAPCIAYKALYGIPLVVDGRAV